MNYSCVNSKRISKRLFNMVLDWLDLGQDRTVMADFDGLLNNSRIIQEMAHLTIELFANNSRIIEDSNNSPVNIPNTRHGTNNKETRPAESD